QHTTGPHQLNISITRNAVTNRGLAGYVRTPDHFRFLPGAIDGMRLLQDHGWQLVIVTNQDAAGWKLLTEAQLAKVHDRMLAMLHKEGVRVAEVYYCPQDRKSGG